MAIPTIPSGTHARVCAHAPWQYYRNHHPKHIVWSWTGRLADCQLYRDSDCWVKKGPFAGWRCCCGVQDIRLEGHLWCFMEVPTDV